MKINPVWIGVALLVSIYAVSGFRAMRLHVSAPPERGGDIEIFVGHSRLETGAREGLEAVAREYEARNPGVKIRLLAVPQAQYSVWQQTKVLSPEAPDLFELAGGLPSDLLLRHFVPLGSEADRINPYNAGTEADRLAWRDTFFDGISSQPAYDANYATIMGIPATQWTTRFFINHDLWKDLTGTSEIPDTWQEFVDATTAAKAKAATKGETVIPVAAAGTVALAFLQDLMGSQTQRLGIAVEGTHRAEIFANDMTAGLVAGHWSLDHPSVLDGLRLVQDAIQMLPPGALQLRRDDALFYFAQGRALAMPGSSFDVESVREQSPFNLAIVPMPWPDLSDPRYSDNMLGRSYEAANASQMTFAVTRRSDHPEIALDFLRFLTSLPGSQTFSDVSGWLSPIVGVEAPELAREFAPVETGYPAGFSLSMGSETNRVFTTALHRLRSPQVSVEDFVREIAPRYRAAAERDTRNSIRHIVGNSAILETVMGAHWVLQELQPENSAAHAERVRELTESQIFQEEASFRRLYDLGIGTDELME